MSRIGARGGGRSNNSYRPIDSGKLCSACFQPACFIPVRLCGIFSLTPCFSWVWKCEQVKNRFNGLPHCVETVATGSSQTSTQLKPGVNEKGFEHGRGAIKYSG